jgi:tRNA(fMet)-specific endonuclease VapC
VTARPARGPVVVDTNVYGAELVPNSKLAVLYEPLLAGRAVLISFQTAAELRYGALLRGWGPARMLKLEARINAAETVHSGPEVIDTCARLRVACNRVGHALAQRDHDADRWIAATAIRLGVPLVSDDRIFEGVPGLTAERAR